MPSEFLEFVNGLEIWVRNRMEHTAEVSRLQTELIASQTRVTAMEKKLKTAQHLLGVEKDKRIASEHQVRTFE